jgi:hypothetical protein
MHDATEWLSYLQLLLVKFSAAKQTTISMIKLLGNKIRQILRSPHFEAADWWYTQSICML